MQRGKNENSPNLSLSSGSTVTFILAPPNTAGHKKKSQLATTPPMLNVSWLVTTPSMLWVSRVCFVFDIVSRSALKGESQATALLKHWGEGAVSISDSFFVRPWPSHIPQFRLGGGLNR